MIAQVRTITFRGVAIFTCRRCNHELRFTDTDGNVQAILVDNGQTLTLSSARGGILHQCGRQRYWWCDHCEVELEPEQVQRPPQHVLRSRIRRHREYYTTCMFCGSPARQRTKIESAPG